MAQLVVRSSALCAGCYKSLCREDGIEVSTLDTTKEFNIVKLWQAMDDLHLDS